MLVQSWGTVGRWGGEPSSARAQSGGVGRPPILSTFPTDSESGSVAGICPVLEELFRYGCQERAQEQLKEAAPLPIPSTRAQRRLARC